jgi:hypothetical protein
MANSSKNKGDRGEREAMRVLAELIPELLVDGYDRAKSAGIPHDRGDLHVLDDTAVQVKHWSRDSLGAALLDAAFGASEQASNARKDGSLGMASIAGAKKDGVRWLAAVTVEMADPLGLRSVVEFKKVSALSAWVQDDEGPKGYLVHPRTSRIATFTAPRRSVVVAPIEAWTHAYAEAVADASA